MTLAEKIILLRTENKLSQGDLAEKIGVSRQSVSKWETGVSTPDLDKLVLLAEIFNITIDELVKGDSIKQNNAPEESEQKYVSNTKISLQRVIGVCILILGGICAIFGVVFMPILVLPAIYLIICSVICFLVKQHAGLAVAWFTFLTLLVLSPMAYWLTAITSAKIIIVVIVICFAVTLGWTVIPIYKRHKGKK